MSATMQIALKSNSKLFSLAVVLCSIVSAVPATTQTYLCWYVSDFLINCKGSSHTKLLPEFFQRHEWWGSGGKWWRHATLGWVNHRNYILLVYIIFVIYIIDLISKIIVGFLSDNPWVLVLPTPVTQTLWDLWEMGDSDPWVIHPWVFLWISHLLPMGQYDLWWSLQALVVWNNLIPLSIHFLFLFGNHK